MKQQKSVFLSAGVGLAAVFLLFVGCTRSIPREISIFPAGTTNGIVGFTNGAWAVYWVTNHTTNSFWYAGAKIELKTTNGWIVDPVLTPTEVGGWVAPRTRVWRDDGSVLTNNGSFHIFFNVPEHGVRWRASLRFVRRSSVVPALSTAKPSVSAGLVEEALSILDRSTPYVDCPLPEAFR